MAFKKSHATRHSLPAPKTPGDKRLMDAIFGEPSVVPDISPQLPTARAIRALTESLVTLGQRGYSQEEIHSLVVPKRTLARRNARREPLSVEETDKAIRLERIARLAERVFGNTDKANRWMRKAKRQLGGETPLAFLSSESGARIVEEMLERIDYGMIS